MRRKLKLNLLRFTSHPALQALLPLVVGSYNKDYEENPCRILPKFASRTSHNPDVIFSSCHGSFCGFREDVCLSHVYKLV